MPYNVLLIYLKYYKKRDNDLLKSLLRFLIRETMVGHGKYSRTPSLRDIIPLDSEIEELEKSKLTEDEKNLLWERLVENGDRDN